MKRLNVYSGAGLDRADALRGDSARLAALSCDPETRFVAVWRARSFLETRADGASNAVWLRGAAAIELAARADERVFLGLGGGVAYVAFDVSSHEAPERLAAIGGRGRFIDLREVGGLLPRGDGAILAYARGLTHWHRRHRFCGRCGAPTESRRGGHQRVCTNGACGVPHFPRTDPAVIMLVHDGSRCVLGRKRGWPPGLHSTLAGFVEPGESLEEAVVREVGEEVGLALAVEAPVYHSSQPWPFPASLMLGFHARARAAPLVVDSDELESALWVDRKALRRLREDESFRLPSHDSIARRLIEDWLAGG